MGCVLAIELIGVFDFMQGWRLQPAALKLRMPLAASSEPGLQAAAGDAGGALNRMYL